MTFERSEKFYRKMILMYKMWASNIIIIIKEMDNNATPAVVENIAV